MADVVANVLYGINDLYFGPVGEDLPELNDNDDGLLVFGENWVEVGLTEGGLSIAPSTTKVPLRVDQFNADLDDITDEEHLLIKINMAESDLAHYLWALGNVTKTTIAAGADQSAQDILKAGNVEAGFLKMAICGISPEGFFRVFELHKTKAVSVDEILIEKTNKRILVVTRKVYVDPTQTAGEQFFKVYDMTAVPTS